MKISYILLDDIEQTIVIKWRPTGTFWDITNIISYDNYDKFLKENS